MSDSKAQTPSAAEEYAPEAREPAGFRLTDAAIKDQVYRRLIGDAELDAARIVIEVKDGEVTLSGAVRQCLDMQKAEQHACAVDGVKVLRNRLTTDAPLPGIDPQRPAGAAPKMGKPGYEL
jgi:osmotically-inducible protein OsmY